MRHVDSFLLSGLRPRLTANGGSPHRGRVSFFARAKKETKESTPRMAQRLPRLRGFGSRRCPDATSCRGGAGADIPVCAPAGARPKPCGARVRHTGLKKYGATCWCFRIPVARAEYRSPTGSIQASPCLSPRRVVCARRVGERPVGRGRGGVVEDSPVDCPPAERVRRIVTHPGHEGEVARSGVSFLLVTFLWTSKEKSPAVGQPPTSTRGRRPLDLPSPLEMP